MTELTNREAFLLVLLVLAGLFALSSHFRCQDALAASDTAFRIQVERRQQCTQLEEQLGLLKRTMTSSLPPDRKVADALAILGGTKKEDKTCSR